VVAIGIALLRLVLQLFGQLKENTTKVFVAVF